MMKIKSKKDLVWPKSRFMQAVVAEVRSKRIELNLCLIYLNYICNFNYIFSGNVMQDCLWVLVYIYLQPFSKVF